MSLITEYEEHDTEYHTEYQNAAPIGLSTRSSKTSRVYE